MSDESDVPMDDPSPLAKSKFFRGARPKPGAKPKAPLQLSMEMFQQLIGTLQAASATQPANPEVLAALELARQSAETNAQIQTQVRNQVRPSNPKHLNVTAFTTDSRCAVCRTNLAALASGRRDFAKHDPADDDYGHPKPKLTYLTFFCGIPQRADDLTPLEVELFNSFTESKEAHHGKWTAVLDRDGTKKRLRVKIPCGTSDDMAGAPPLAQVLTELLYGESVGDPLQAMGEIAQLKRQIAELQAAIVSA